MQITTREIHFSSDGNSDMIDITSSVEKEISGSLLVEGIANLFVVGSTAALTTIECESGLKKDYPEFFEKIIPSNKNYHHDQTWHDGNRHSHIRASLQGPSLSIPFKNKNLLLGTWQQIILIDFDTRPRKRTVIVQLIGLS